MAIAIGDHVGFSRDDLDRFGELEPVSKFGQSWQQDARLASRFFNAGQSLIDRLPPRPRRSEAEQAAAEALHTQLRAARTAFLRRHAAALYGALTDQRRRFLRIEDLVYRAAEGVPGLVPSRQQIVSEREHPQQDKDG